MKFTMRCERIKPGKPNINNRAYSAASLQSMVKQIKEKLSYGVFFGRLGTSESTKVRMDDVAFRVLEPRIDPDGHLAADCEVVQTPRGDDLRKLLEASGTEGFEIIPFGIGSTTVRDGVYVVGEDYKLASLDIEPRLTKEDYAGRPGEADA
jgi:hypothetical protein